MTLEVLRSPLVSAGGAPWSREIDEFDSQDIVLNVKEKWKPLVVLDGVSHQASAISSCTNARQDKETESESRRPNKPKSMTLIAETKFHHQRPMKESRGLLETAPQIDPNLGYIPRPAKFTSMSEAHEDYFINRYAFVKKLGEGSCGKVRLARHRQTGELVSVKMINRDFITNQPKLVKCVEREIASLTLLNHPNIANMFEVILTKKRIYIIMEYASGGELFDHIVKHRRLDENESRRLFRQILRAVAHCHKSGIVHRDLKPENILLDDIQDVKIIDFGFSNRYDESDMLKTNCGSPAYSAPELLENRPYFGPEVDIWSMGVILFTMICGYLPFDGPHPLAIYRKIMQGELCIPDHVSKQAVDLLCGMLTVDTEKRMDVYDIRYHPWFKVNSEEYPININYTKNHNVVDIEVVAEIEQLGFLKDSIVSAILNGSQNEITTMYYLLEQKKRYMRLTSHITYVKKQWKEKRTKPCLLDKIPSTIEEIDEETEEQPLKASGLLEAIKSVPNYPETRYPSITTTASSPAKPMIDDSFMKHISLFSASLITNLSPTILVKIIRTVLKQEGFTTAFRSNCIRCERKASSSKHVLEIQFIIEICKISLLPLHGIRMVSMIGAKEKIESLQKSILKKIKKSLKDQLE